MAAAFANASWDLGTARRSQDYRSIGGSRGGNTISDSQSWVNAVVASSNRAASQNTAATSAAGTLGGLGLQSQASLGGNALRASADLGSAGIAASSNLSQAKASADAMVKRERIARGSEAMQGIKMAGGLGLLAYGMTAL